MNVRIIAQINQNTQEKNVVFTQDFMTPVEDFLIESWGRNYSDSRGLLFVDDEAASILMDTDLRTESVGQPYQIEASVEGIRRLGAIIGAELGL
jgi:hypothetical protein